MELEEIKEVLKDELMFEDGKDIEELLEEFEVSREKAWQTWLRAGNGCEGMVKKLSELFRRDVYVKCYLTKKVEYECTYQYNGLCA